VLPVPRGAHALLPRRPAAGTWHCFGACGTGGDSIGFLQRIDNLPFLEALEVLAARTGVELPKRTRAGGAGSRDDRGEQAVRDTLERALVFYRRELATPEGARAAAYLRERGIADATAEAFGVGYAPANGQALVASLRDAGLDLADAIAAGLVRRTDEGRAYDFFRGRLVIPIRDERGRAVGFGARRLRDDDDASGPKYVNTSETALFHKGRLVYALDRALPRIRREGRIVLVEGYTDVMAAHQHGFDNVVAVLGTSTTEDHAALIRRSGARRATLVFDGDEAGGKAAGRALHGLLPLEIEIDVVALRGGVDPCDLLVRDGAAAFRAHLDLARGWFEHVLDGLAGRAGRRASRSRARSTASSSSWRACARPSTANRSSRSSQRASTCPSIACASSAACGPARAGTTRSLRSGFPHPPCLRRGRRRRVPQRRPPRATRANAAPGARSSAR
jgi:DNA primase